MKDEGLSKFMRHTASMRRLTKAEVVNTYWQLAHQIASTDRLGFVIRGNVSWESERPDGVSGGGIWLKSNTYDWKGKHIAEEPVLTYLQMYMNSYETWGTVEVKIDPNDASVSKPLIEEACGRAMRVCNLMSLIFGGSLELFPAQYGLVRRTHPSPPPERPETESWGCIALRRSVDEHVCIILKDEHITDELFPMIQGVEVLPLELRRVVETAIDWHACGNRYQSGLNRFVNYWESIELLGNFFYKRLPAGVVGRKTPAEKKMPLWSYWGRYRGPVAWRRSRGVKKFVDRASGAHYSLFWA